MFLFLKYRDKNDQMHIATDFNGNQIMVILSIYHRHDITWNITLF